MSRKEISIRRKLRISIFIICVLGVWLKNVYDDKTFIEHDIDLYKIYLCDKDTTIVGLNKKIDSLIKTKQRVKIVTIYPKKEYKKPIVVDTIIPVVDTIRKDTPPDTLKSE